MMRVHAGERAESLQRHVFFIMLVDDVTDAPHEFDLWIQHLRAPRVTTLAGAEAGLLGRFGKRKEADLLAFWSSRRTRRPAIDSGRAHGEHEAAVARGIARENGIPHLRIVRDSGHLRCYLQHLILPHLSILPARYRRRF